MPGAIQSVERAAALLRVLGGAARPLGLGELAAALDLAKPTAHGILRTLCDVGFVEQDRFSSRYRLGRALAELGRGSYDPHDLRAAAMNWADALAGATGLTVALGVVEGHAVRLVHHVFRPDGSPQHLRTGETVPAHATSMGKCLLAFAPVAAPPLRELVLDAWTARTRVEVGALERDLELARQHGWAAEQGEFTAGVGGLAAPVRATGGLVVAALAVLGPTEELFDAAGRARRAPVHELQRAARSLSAALTHP